jgi:hypothetical protein
MGVGSGRWKLKIQNLELIYPSTSFTLALLRVWVIAYSFTSRARKTFAFFLLAPTFGFIF